MDLATLRRWWPLGATLGLLLLAALAATRSAPQLNQLDPAEVVDNRPPLLPAVPVETPSSGVPPQVDEAGLPGWIGTAVLWALGLAALAVAVFVAVAVIRDVVRRRARRSGRLDARPAGSTADDLVAALDAGLVELSDADRDPRRAVIACWVRLEQAAAAAGTRRNPGDSPTDLVSRLLTEQRVDGQLLAELAEVYRQARYATHTVDDQMRVQARTALERLRADLGAGAPV